MLVIFDCDGTLIDSEILWKNAWSEILKEEGIEIDPHEFNARYAGMTGQEVLPVLEEELERNLPGDLMQRIDDRAGIILEKVQPIKGVEDMLEQLDYPCCVCSNTRSDRLEINMRRTGLWDRFRPYVFSAVDVGNKAPKPDPNVFLYAAEKLETDAADCFVLEDSFHGIRAAKQAGMRVIGFTGASHTYPGHAEHLMDSGAETVIHRLTDFPATLQALISWREA